MYTRVHSFLIKKEDRNVYREMLIFEEILDT